MKQTKNERKEFWREFRFALALVIAWLLTLFEIATAYASIPKDLVKQEIEPVIYCCSANHWQIIDELDSLTARLAPNAPRLTANHSASPIAIYAHRIDDFDHHPQRNQGAILSQYKGL